MALPKRIESNQPNLNRGLGSVANDNTRLTPANDNVRSVPANDNKVTNNTYPTPANDNIANSFTADRASDAGKLRTANPINDTVADTDEEPYEAYDTEDGDDETEENTLQQQAMAEAIQRQQEQRENVVSASFASARDQQQLNQEQQQQIAVNIASQKQMQLRRLQQQDQQLDAETEGLMKDLSKFRESRTHKELAFWKPRLTFAIDDLSNRLKNQSNHLAPKKRVAFLTGALLTLDSLIAMLKGFRFFTAFADAMIWWAKWVFKTIETIIGAIIIFMLGFILVPFVSILFYIDKIPLFKGDVTHEVVTLIEKLKKRQQFWQAQLQELKQIVARQDQRKANQKTEQQLQKPV